MQDKKTFNTDKYAHSDMKKKKPCWTLTDDGEVDDGVLGGREEVVDAAAVVFLVTVQYRIQLQVGTGGRGAAPGVARQQVEERPLLQHRLVMPVLALLDGLPAGVEAAGKRKRALRKCVCVGG